MKVPKTTEEVAQLFRVTDEEPEPRATRKASTEVLSGDYEEHHAPEDEMEEYWRIYENFSVVRTSIYSFSQEVVEPGWYVVASNEETATELTEWLTESVTTGGEEGQDFSEILRRVTVQREVRGTALVEKVRGSNSDKIVALQLLNPETFKVYTQPQSNVLVKPDDVDLDAEEITESRQRRRRASRDTVPVTDEGEGAAYVQYDHDLHRWNNRDEVFFTNDEIIKFTRDDDVGEVFGTSRIESVADRVHGLQQKLKDNDEAIAQKAYPFWMFRAGPEDGEDMWDEEDMDDFLENHDAEKFGPGMKQMVPGDLSLETHSGDTADIYESVKYDIDHISVGLPMPQFSLGAFGEDVNRARAEAQENRLRRQVKDVRGELEAKFTPLLREVARERGLDDPDEVALKVGRPGEPSPEAQEVNRNMIQYQSNSPQARQGQRGPRTDRRFSAGPNDTNGPPSGGVVPRANDPTTDNPGDPGSYTATPDATGVDVSGGGDEGESLPVVEMSGDPSGSVWDAEDPGLQEVEELADPRYVSVRSDTRSLKNTIAEYLREVRDETLDRLDEKGSSRQKAIESERIMNRVIADAKGSHGLQAEIDEAMEETVRRTIDSLNKQYHSPPIETHYGVRAESNKEAYSRSAMASVEEMTEDLRHYLQQIVVRGVQNGEDFDRIEESVRERFSDEEIDRRSRLVAHMQLKKTTESTKLKEYEAHGEIVGVEVVNPCTEDTTRLCRNLAGCTGTEVRAFFGPDRDVASQLEADVGGEELYDGFTPLPAAPPYHYGCRSTLVPVSAKETDSLSKHGSTMFEETDPVMTPEGPGIVVRVMDHNFLIQPNENESHREVQAAPDNTAYVVSLMGQGRQVFRIEDLQEADVNFQTTEPSSDDEESDPDREEEN
jgi:hypothetical protein